MTPDVLRAAIASARERPRMYGDSPGNLETYLHGLVAGAYDGDRDVRDAWSALRDPPLRPGVHPDATFDSVCDHALRVVAALCPPLGPPDDAGPRQRQCGDRGCKEPAYRCDGCGAKGCDYGLRKECRCDGGPDMSPLYEDEPAQPAARAQPDALDADDTREVLAATVAVVTEALGLTAPADVVALQLDQHIANLAARLKRLEGERDAAEAEVLWLRAGVDAEVLRLRAGVDALKVQAAAAEGEAFATTHKYAAGAIMGGVAHRSEVDDGSE